MHSIWSVASFSNIFQQRRCLLTCELAARHKAAQYSSQEIIIGQVKVKVYFSHTRYRAMDPELIPAYRQSACR